MMNITIITIFANNVVIVASVVVYTVTIIFDILYCLSSSES